MKKIFIILLCFFTFTLCGCDAEAKSVVLENMSDLRINYFEAKGENYYIDLSCGYREEIFAYDGVSYNKVECGVLSVEFDDIVSYSYISGVLNIDGEEMQVVLEKSPFDNKYMVDIEKIINDENDIEFNLKNSSEKLKLKNVSSLWKVDYEKAISTATNHLSEYLESLFFNGRFNGEGYLKIVSKNNFNRKFWYFSCVDKAGKFVSVLIDVESGEVFDN